MKIIVAVGGHQTKVDDDVFEWASKLKWYMNKTPSNKIGYLITHIHKDGKRTSGYLHRMIMGVERGVQVDHINRDSLDNRRANLRTATCSQNVSNCDKRPNTVSRFKGVIWHIRMQRWQAKIGVNGKRIHLGTFLSEVDAARAYDRAAVIHHGEFAVTNGVL